MVVLQSIFASGTLKQNLLHAEYLTSLGICCPRGLISMSGAFPGGEVSGGRTCCAPAIVTGASARSARIAIERQRCENKPDREPCLRICVSNKPLVSSPSVFVQKFAHQWSPNLRGIPRVHH